MAKIYKELIYCLLILGSIIFSGGSQIIKNRSYLFKT